MKGSWTLSDFRRLATPPKNQFLAKFYSDLNPSLFSKDGIKSESYPSSLKLIFSVPSEYANFCVCSPLGK